MCQYISDITLFLYQLAQARLHNVLHFLESCMCVCVCVCVSVTQHLTFHVFIRATNDLTFSAADEGRNF